MEIAFHLGVHCTDDDALLKCLLRNRDVLLAEGISVPGPSRYRPMIRETLQMLRGQPASAEAQEVLLDAIIEEDDADRLILSNDQFLGVYGRVLANNQLYPQAGERMRAMRGLFPDHDVEIHMGLRDLATFLPACFEASQIDDFGQFMGKCDLRQISWLNMVQRIRAAVPDCPVTIWANEDTPMIWPHVCQEVSGHSSEIRLEGTDEILRGIMQPAGFKRLQSYLAANPPVDEEARQRVVAAFLDKYVDDAATEQEIELPGWSDRVISFLSSAYETDLEDCVDLPGVTVITP
jgi:hypothetical protein